MNTCACPVCDDGEVEGHVDVKPRTHWYPGHRELQVTGQTCACDLSDHEEELCDRLQADRHAMADDPLFADRYDR